MVDTDKFKDVKEDAIIYAVSLHEKELPFSIIYSAKNLECVNILYRGTITSVLDAASKTILKRCSEKGTLSNYTCYSYQYERYIVHICAIECVNKSKDTDESMLTTKTNFLQNKMHISIITNAMYGKKYVINIVREVSKLIKECKSHDEVHTMLNDVLKANIKPFDKFEKVSSGLADVKSSMIVNVKTLLTQGEDIDDLVKKSGDLNSLSKSAVINARRANRRCPGCSIL